MSETDGKHSHDGGHEHSHAGPNMEDMDAAQQLAFRWGVGLNLSFCIAEGLIGWFFQSMALVADAVHNLTDVMGLVLGWAAIALAARKATGRLTYGWKRTTIVATVGNAMLLVGSSIFLAWESVNRFFHPSPVDGYPMIIAATVGIGVNGFTAWLFTRGSQDDINVRGAFLHLAADAVVSLGVVISGIAIVLTGATWVDPVAGLLIVGVIIKGSWGLTVESLMQLIDAVPARLSLADVRDYLQGVAGVVSVHDLHIWNISTSVTALSTHLRVTPETDRDLVLAEVRAGLAERFRIRHPTIQVETGDCPDEHLH